MPSGGADVRLVDRNHLDIVPRLYELWRSSRTETAREFDREWSPQIENARNRFSVASSGT